MHSIDDILQPARVGRLDHLLRGWGIATKQEVHALAKEGRICINAFPCTEGGHLCGAEDRIFMDGKEISPSPYLSIMLHKPSAYVCMGGDLRYPDVCSLLPQDGPTHTLFSVGRLDVDTEGLLIMTNCGALSQRISSPDSEITKGYLVSLGRALCDDAEMRLQSGIRFISGEQYRPAKLIRLSPDHALVFVTEGKYHEVKRLIRGCGSFVKALRRIAIGQLTLDPTLPAGAYRTLTENDIKRIFLPPDENALVTRYQFL